MSSHVSSDTCVWEENKRKARVRGSGAGGDAVPQGEGGRAAWESCEYIRAPTETQMSPSVYGGFVHHVGCVLAQRVLGLNHPYKSLESSMKPSAHSFAKCVQNRCKCIQNAKNSEMNSVS